MLQTPMTKFGKVTEPLYTKDTKSLTMGKQEQKILSVLKSANYAVTTVEVSEKIGNTVDNTSRALRGLRASGVVENGLTEYVNSRAVLTWQLTNKDIKITKVIELPEKKEIKEPEYWAFEKSAPEVSGTIKTKFFDAELKQAIKVVLELIIKKL